MNPTTFALYFGNRGFFPEALIASAREEMKTAVEAAGYGTLLLEAEATRCGAVETPAEGKRYAQFLAEQRGQYDGVILCLPNFGDETGAVAALQEAGVPILVQAYPDKLEEMAFHQRRDAFCGKLSVLDVFYQYGVPCTAFTPHVAAPTSDIFTQHLHWFAATCRVVKRMRRLTVGAIGARTTPFKTIRFDELALQKHGVTCETFDLSEVFARVRSIVTSCEAFTAKAKRLHAYTGWEGVPQAAFEQLCKLSLALDEMIADYGLEAIALRCWLEIEQELGVSPCVLLSELNDRGIVAACEMDVASAVAMTALAAASQRAATCLDWNNNYADAADKCILFHCGPVPQALMCGPGQVIDHPMFAKTLGAGHGFGCNVGRIAPAPLTYAGLKTQEGKLQFYLGEGHFTEDTIPEDFFGCAGVAEIPGLQELLLAIGRQGFRHHVGVTAGKVAVPVREALTRYLGYEETGAGA
jgi:L-fucose isomerase-like protein